MKNQPVLYESLKTILSYTDPNLRINMSQRMPSIRATERAVPLKIRYLSIKDTTVDINNVRYKLGVCRDYPNGDIPQFVKRENAHGGVSNDFDRFGFEIPIGSNLILPGDISVQSGDEQVVRTDTDELEELYQTALSRSEIHLKSIAEMESEKRAWTSEWKGHHQFIANYTREKLKPFHCKRHNLPRPFNCYIQISVEKHEKVKPLQKLAYTRKLYEAVKQFNHVLFANRPVIKVEVLDCVGNHVYRIPVGFKISANELKVWESHIALIATILKGNLNTIRVIKWENVENWWQHRLVRNAKELITKGSQSAEESCLMLRTFGNRNIRFHNLRILSTEQYCELIENWMSVKREVGSELWIGLEVKRHRNNVLEKIQTRMEVVRRNERCVTVHDKNGTQVAVCEERCEDESIHHRWAVKVKIIKN
ncbi:hypothetical protein B9Z55_007765 [Caenorhabditis nigoni]|nr:hypothetical protein B9Z55_007765 [Caenorhabditis nigoni]